MIGTPRPATVFTKQQRIARVANSWDEEPGARDVQARICGGLGWATTQVYPARNSPPEFPLTPEFPRPRSQQSCVPKAMRALLPSCNRQLPLIASLQGNEYFLKLLYVNSWITIEQREEVPERAEPRET